MSAAELAAASAVVFLAFFARGVSGFGSATVAIPLLVHVIPLKVAVPLLLVHDLLSTAATAHIDRRAVVKSEILALLPFSMLGVIFGVTLLLALPATPLLAALGALVIVFGVRTIANPQGRRHIARGWCVPAGLIGGALGGAFGIGAATPTMIYLSHRLADKHAVRGTFAAFGLFDYAYRLVVFAVTGLLLSRELLVAVLATLPAMALGMYLGNRLHGRISGERAFQVIGGLLVASGASLLWKALR